MRKVSHFYSYDKFTHINSYRANRSRLSKRVKVIPCSIYFLNKYVSIGSAERGDMSRFTYFCHIANYIQSIHFQCRGDPWGCLSRRIQIGYLSPFGFFLQREYHPIEFGILLLKSTCSTFSSPYYSIYKLEFVFIFLKFLETHSKKVVLCLKLFIQHLLVIIRLFLIKMYQLVHKKYLALNLPLRKQQLNPLSPSQFSQFPTNRISSCLKLNYTAGISSAPSKFTICRRVAWFFSNNFSW